MKHILNYNHLNESVTRQEIDDILNIAIDEGLIVEAQFFRYATFIDISNRIIIKYHNREEIYSNPIIDDKKFLNICSEIYDRFYREDILRPGYMSCIKSIEDGYYLFGSDNKPPSNAKYTTSAYELTTID